MNLQLVISPSGLGKTDYILNDIAKYKENKKIIIITPDQNSYNYEKVLVDKFNGTFNIDVVNFSTLGKRLGKLLGLDSTILEDEVKIFYYFEIAKRLKNKKNFLIDMLFQDITFLSIIDELITELKDYRISEEVLSDYAKTLEEGPHLEKIKAIYEIHVEYNSFLIENEKVDKSQYLNSLITYLEYVDLSNYIFYIDGFYNFSKAEYELISKLLSKSSKLVFSIIGDIGRYTNFKLEHLVENYEINEPVFKLLTREELEKNINYSMDVYRKSHEVMGNINQIIKDNKLNEFDIATFFSKSIEENYLLEFSVDNLNIKSNKIEKLDQIRFKNEEVYHLAKEFPNISKSSLNKNVENIEVYSAPNIELEVRQTARNIIKELKKNKYKFQDIAILYRDADYLQYEYIFKEYGINIHSDVDKDISNHRLLRLINNIFEYSDENFKEDILNILKSNLTNFTEQYYTVISDKESRVLEIEDIERILNLKFVKTFSDIKKDDFTRSIKNKYDKEELAIVKDLLLNIRELIFKVSQETTVAGYIKSLVELLENFQVKMVLDRPQDDYENIDELENVSVDRQVYSKFLKILENIEQNFSYYEIGYSEFYNLLKLSLGTIKYSNIPLIEDSVVMSQMDLAKVENKKVIFILGFNKDVLPKLYNSQSIIDDSDKDLLSQNGIYLAPTQKIRIIDEDFVAYIALSRAREKIYISYTTLTSSYTKTQASMYLDSICKILGNSGSEIIINEVEDVLNFNLEKISYYDLRKNKIEIYSKTELVYIYNKLLSSLNSVEDKEYTLELIEMYRELIGEIKNTRYSEEFKEEKNLTDSLDKEVLSRIDHIRENSIFSSIVDSKGKSFSYSQIQEYQNNPYIYFVKRILGISEEENYDINPLKVGSFIHAILDDELCKKYISENIMYLDYNLSDKKALKLNLEELQQKIIKIEADTKNLIKKIIRTSQKDEIVEFVDLLNSNNLYKKYNLTNLIDRLVGAISVEIYYVSISNYRILETEKRFRLNFKNNMINFIYDGKIAAEYKLNKIYDVDEFNFNGIIDRIDYNGNNYLVIDYKNSERDFDYKSFYNQEVSQLLLYMLASMLMYKIDLENITGVFYRQVSNSKNDIKKFRLRGLVNESTMLVSEEMQELIYTRLTKNGIHGSDVHKAYTTEEMSRLIEMNIDYIYKIAKEIQDSKFTLDNRELEEISLFNYTLSRDTKLEKDKVEIKSKDFKEHIKKKL